MKITRVEVTNFRLLRDTMLSFDASTTLIVGRNNSGKTSLAELFRRLQDEKTARFTLEDFSLSSHTQFCEAYQLWKADPQETSTRDIVPKIEAKITIEYDLTESIFGTLADFVIDLDEASHNAIVLISFGLPPTKVDSLFSDIPTQDKPGEAEERTALCRALKLRIPKLFEATVVAIDPNDSTNTKVIEWTKFNALLRSDFVNAQRGLDDDTVKDRDVIGKVLASLFKTAASETAPEPDKEVVGQLKAAVAEIEAKIDESFNNELKPLFPALEIFGYPGLRDPRLLTETTLEVERLLTNNTKMRYAGANGITLPEAFNGLGTRNLIIILLRLLEFFKSYTALPERPGVHLIFIEEPEAHLHPQMQEVFVSQIARIKKLFEDSFSQGKAWPVQFVLSTHSSHIANAAPFESLRYFFAREDPGQPHHYRTRVKDLQAGLDGNPNLEFLHKYMTLTRCDLLFADKAIIIEGTAERLILPRIIAKLDEGSEKKLSSQYITTMEVGGAYAHIFYDLLDFLELHCAIITDIDSVDSHDEHRAVEVSQGDRTSNACIRNWFGNPDVTPAELKSKSSSEKVRGVKRLAYQIPESADAPCGRTFEDAFILANPTLFGVSDGTILEMERSASLRAKKDKKSDFALTYAISNTVWDIPRYLREVLEWLVEPPPIDPGLALIATNDAACEPAKMPSDDE